MDWYSSYLCTCNHGIASASVGGGSAKAKQACLCIRLAPHLSTAIRTKKPGHSTTPADNRTDRSKAFPGPLRADEEIGRSKLSDNPDFGYSGSRVLTNLLSTKLWLLLIKLNCA